MCVRNNVVIDDELLKEALAVTGLRSKKAVVDEGLRRIVRGSQLKAINKLKGLAAWEGNNRSLRRNRELRQ